MPVPITMRYHLSTMAVHTSAVQFIPRRILFSLSIVLLASVIPCHAEAPQLWVYCPTNLLVDANLDKLDALWKRAHAAGYTYALLEDSKLSRLDMLESNTKHYHANIERVKRIAAADQITLVPAVFSIGYSNDLLGHDPNLAEGMPVIDTPFTVHGDVATVDTDNAPALGKMTFKDETVKLDGNTATVNRCESNARFVYHLKLEKFRCYHVSVMVKTGSWNGLKKNVVVINWNFGNRDKSLKFFADRGNRQIIAGYYNSDLKDLSQWIESAGKVNGVVGMMYTTWSQNYSQLEKFAEMCKGDRR
jgi:hypothetical protein